jgi:RNA polymerase sigma factor (sigma-70 family)
VETFEGDETKLAGTAKERHEFAQLMEQVRNGSRDAAETLLARYGPHIQRVVRHKLHRRLRTRFDSLDFVQDVWASFFANPPALQRYDSPEALLKFLVAVARNKVMEVVRQGLKTEKHNLNRERSLDGSVAIQAAGVPARQPTPSQLFAAEERWNQLLHQIPDQHQQMLHLLREGNTHEQIARQLGVNERTVRRALAKLAPRRVS